MRWLAWAGLAVLSTGCTLDVGDGQIPPFDVDGRLELPSAAARAGVQNASFRDEYGEQLDVRVSPGMTFVSVSEELQFFSAAESALFQQQLGDKADAVSRIDVEVKRCEIDDSSTGAPMPDLTAEAVLDGTVLGPVGMMERVALPQATRDKVMTAVKAGQAVTLSVGANVSCTPDHVDEIPSAIDLHLTLQPVLVIDELKAL